MSNNKAKQWLFKISNYFSENGDEEQYAPPLTLKELCELLQEYAEQENAELREKLTHCQIKNKCSCSEPHYGFKTIAVCTDCNGIKDDEYWRKLKLHYGNKDAKKIFNNKNNKN